MQVEVFLLQNAVTSYDHFDHIDGCGRMSK